MAKLLRKAEKVQLLLKIDEPTATIKLKNYRNHKDQRTRHLFPASEYEILASDVKNRKKGEYTSLSESLKRIKVLKKKN
jgi:hypothetical protein